MNGQTTSNQPLPHQHNDKRLRENRARPLQTRAERKLAFLSARQRGAGINEAARIAGVHIGTGTRWERARKAGIAEEATEREATATLILSKPEVAAILSRELGSGDTPVQYKAALAEKLAKIQGYESPRQIEVTDTTPQRPLREMIVLWAAEAAPTKPFPLNNEVDITPLIGPAPQPAPTKALQAGSAIDAIVVGDQAQPDEPRSPLGGGDEAAPTNSPTATNSPQTPSGGNK